MTKLTPCFDWNFGACTASFNTGKERYLPSQMQISNGTAKLVAEPLAPSYASTPATRDNARTRPAWCRRTCSRSRDRGSVLSSQTLVSELEVDYIRIYQQQ